MKKNKIILTTIVFWILLFSFIMNSYAYDYMHVGSQDYYVLNYNESMALYNDLINGYYNSDPLYGNLVYAINMKRYTIQSVANAIYNTANTYINKSGNVSIVIPSSNYNIFNISISDGTPPDQPVPSNYLLEKMLRDNEDELFLPYWNYN